jgi:hypothetical protein
MDPGDILSSTIATVSLLATATLAYRQTRLQARLTAIETTRRREQIEASQHADVQATVAGTPTALQLVLANDARPRLGSLGHRSASRLRRSAAVSRPGRTGAGPGHAAARGSAPVPGLTLAETTERVQVVVSWKDEAGPHQESFTVQLP